MEEDEEFIKKLMTMLGNGKEIKIKSSNGQTIKVSLDGSSYNQTETDSEWLPQFDHQNLQIQKLNQSEGVDGSNDFREIYEDFNALSLSQNHQNIIQQKVMSQESLDQLQIKGLCNEIGVKRSNSKKQVIFQKFIEEKQQKAAFKQKPKKISLANKNKKNANEAVLNFINEQNALQKKEQPVNTLKAPLVLSSPLIKHRSQEQKVLIHFKSDTVKQNLQYLKQNHPEEMERIELIGETLSQLQQKLDQSYSEILSSSISNSISMKLDSFDFSLMSMNNQNSQDPLCSIFAQYLKRVNQVNKAEKKKMPSFLFMYSQPLIDRKGRQIAQQINYFDEEASIQKILKDGKCMIDYIREPATIDKFYYWIKQGIQILHFTGHGVQSKQNYILFQNETGVSVNVDGEKLSQILGEQKYPLKLVFVASCHSESTGKVFIEAGANHVICVRDEYQILDEACQQFVKIFYLCCINSQTTVCESFEFAKKQLILTGKFTKHECQKFILLKNHKQKGCVSFESRSENNEFNDLTYKPYYLKSLPSRVQHYIPRCKDLHEIIKMISQKRRFITIVGQSGIGKSTIVRQLVRYIQFRNYFKDGVIYLEIRTCETMLKLFQILDLEIFQKSQLKLNKTMSQNIQRLVKELVNHNLLIVMDNCQNIMISEDREIFKKMIELIMKNCTNVYFVFTHRNSIGRQIDYCSQILYELNRLSDEQSQALFFLKAPRNIKKSQFDDFFNIEKNLKEISQHSFFQFLNGHPEAICLTASLLSQRSLSELYQLLLKPNISNEIDQGMDKYCDNELGINKVVETAMKISLNVLNNKNKEAYEMIKLLSLLPNGLDSQLMAKIFGSGLKWKQTVKKLMNHSLVLCVQKIGLKYYTVHPHIIVHVESQINHEQKVKFHDRICDELAKRLEKIYRNVGTLSQYSQRAQEMFLIEEDNYKAIFLRQLTFIGQKYPLKQFYFSLFQTFANQEDEQQNNLKKSNEVKILATLQASKKRKPLMNQKFVQNQKKQCVDLLIVYYVIILFVVRKIKNSPIETYIDYGITIAQKRNRYLVVANLLRVRACIYLAQRKNAQAKKLFQNAWQEFAQIGCGLGSASCEAAIGYIKFSEEQYASAKMNLESALKYYDEIPHAFGKHYLNRWLCSLKSKMNKTENELINHKIEAQKLLKQTKQNLKSNNINNTALIKHKLGVFVFRFLFDNISLFLEAAFEIDIKPKYINRINNTKKEDKNDKLMILDEIIHEENILSVKDKEVHNPKKIVVHQQSYLKKKI